MKLKSARLGDLAWWRFESRWGWEYRLIRCLHPTDPEWEYAKTAFSHLDEKLESCGGMSIEMTHPTLDGKSDVVSLDHVRPLLAVGLVIKTYSQRWGQSCAIKARIERLEYRCGIPWAGLSVVEGEVIKGDPLCGWLVDFGIPHGEGELDA